MRKGSVARDVAEDLQLLEKAPSSGDGTDDGVDKAFGTLRRDTFESEEEEVEKRSRRALALTVTFKVRSNRRYRKHDNVDC